MNSDIVRQFLNQPVHICLPSGNPHQSTFALSGTIIDVIGDSVLFRTNQKTSAIDARHILSITPATRRPGP